MTEQDVLTLISNDPWMMEVLRAAETLHLPQWAIGAGFVRNKVWNELSSYSNRVHSTDIDLIYFDPTNTNEEVEKDYDRLLRDIINVEWSTKNQARMYLVDNEKPYSSTVDALAHWPETATAIAVTIEDGTLKLIASYGIHDLVNLIVRPCPKFNKGMERVKERMEKKKWLEQWPGLTLEN
ncbi:MAG: nucleotidyltransferase family protein [Candidatus Paceibacterota bacterium]